MFIKVLLPVLACVLMPGALLAIGVINAQVPLHESLAIDGSALDELGYLDVTAYGYGADRTGVTNSTAAIQKAIDDAYENNMVVFFPSGIYKVRDTLNCWQKLYPDNGTTNNRSQLRHANVLAGSTIDKGVTIKLADYSPGFTSEAVKKNLFQFWCTDDSHPDIKDPAYADPTRHYNAEMRNFKIDLGSGNSGAVAIWMQGAQGCNIQNVDVDINSGFAGIASLTGTGSGHAGLTLRNGKYGIWCPDGYMGQSKSSQPMPYLAGCRFLNQSESAIYLDDINGTLTLIGFRITMTNSVNGKAIVLCDSWGDTADSINLVDGTIEMAGAGSIAVANDGRKSVNIENVYIKAGMIVECADDDGDQAGSPVDWYKIHDLSYIGQDEAPGNNKSTPAISIEEGLSVTNKLRSNMELMPPSSTDYEKLAAMHLWKSDFPTFEDKDCYIASSLDPTGSNDVTTALQTLINLHDKVFLPKGTYKISGTITLAKDKKLFGAAKNLSIIQMDPLLSDPGVSNAFYMIETDDDADSQNIVAFLEFQQNPAQTNIASLHWRAGKQSVIRNVQQWYSNNSQKYRTQADFLFSGHGGGKLYNFHLAYNIKPAAGNHRPSSLRFEGVSQPLYVYAVSSEDAWFDGQLDIQNSRNVHIISYKDENTDEVDYADPQYPKFIKIAVNGSTNIGFYGVQNLMFGPQTDAYSTVVYNSDDITILSFARALGDAAAADPTRCNMFYQDADGNGIPELALDGMNAMSKYELGSYARDINGSMIRTLLPQDPFDIRKEYWRGSNGFSIAAGRGKLESGALDYLGSHNYDNVKIVYDFEDITAGAPLTADVLRTRIRAQRDRYGDCYEVCLQRDGKLHILATAATGTKVSVASIATGLESIQGASRRMEILVKDEANGDIKISVRFAPGTANPGTLTWTHPATDTTYKRFRKGTIGFYSSGSVNLIDNFSVNDGLFYDGTTSGASLLFSITTL
jgi:hypothetical protein